MPKGIYIRTEDMKKRRSIACMGRPAYFKGKKHSEETKKLFSEQRLGVPNKSSTKFKKGFSPWIKGKKHSKEVCDKLSLIRKGILLTSEHRFKIYTSAPRGENNPLWIKDRNNLKKSEKKHLDSRYREWMLAVKNRDNWVCRITDSKCEGGLEAHHILPWRDFVELRYEINNGITLCHFHHPKKWEEEKRLIPTFMELVSVSK